MIYCLIFYLICYRATGQDFAPNQTRVLHFVNNPASTAAVAAGRSQPLQKFSTTLEELRHIREENRRLRDMVIQVQNFIQFIVDDRNFAQF